MDRLHSLITERYSPVIFSTKQVEEEKLRLLFDAARWAPSSYNEQPWRFIVGVKDQGENYENILDSLVEANQYWAKYAPVLALSFAKKNSTVKDKPNRFAQYDTGMAVGNLLAQATSMGLYVHQMGGYSREKVIKAFNIEDEFEPMAAMAIGYKGDIELFPDDLKERELKKRVRKPLDDIFL
jgi:nitroreductase